MQVNPDFAQAYGHMGWVYYSLKNYEEAVNFLEKAIRMGQSNLSNHLQLGLSYAYLRQCDKAKEHLQKALAIQPDMPAAQDGLRACP